MLPHCSNSGKFQRPLARYSAEAADLALSRRADLPGARNCSSPKSSIWETRDRQAGKHVPATSKAELGMATSAPESIPRRGREAETPSHPFLPKHFCRGAQLQKVWRQAAEQGQKPKGPPRKSSTCASEARPALPLATAASAPLLQIS